MNKDVLLTKDQIDEHNKRMMNNNHTLFDMSNYYEYLSKDYLYKIIASYVITKDFYNNGKIISKEEINNILRNRNIDKIHGIKPLKAVVANRTNMRSLPTDLAFYNNIDDNHFDRIQASEIHFNRPVYVLHESYDSQWYYIQSYYCRGWVHKKDIVLVTDYEYNFLTNSSSIVIIDPMISIDDHLLDMSVSIPYYGEKNNYYEAIIPESKDGLLYFKKVNIPKKKANIGYLDYTYNNLYNQAFKYLRFPYGWGGLYNGVDCSSFVSNVYRSFGFMFPRNTKDQNKVIGTSIIDLDNLSLEERKKVLDNNYPGVLYMDGHAFIYLYPKNNKHFVINSYGANPMEVINSPLDDTGGKNYYMKLTKLHKID